MGNPWNGPKSLTFEQNLRSYGQKTDFHVYGHKTFTEKNSNFKMATAKLQEIFEYFFNTTSNYIN